MTLNKKQKITALSCLMLLLVIILYLALKPFINISVKPEGYKSEAATSPPFEVIDEDQMTIIITNPSPTP